MAKKKSDPVIEINETWLDLNSITFPSGTDVADILSIVVYKPTRINLSVIIPRELLDDDEDFSKFDVSRQATIRTLKKTMEAKIVESMISIAAARTSEREGNDGAHEEAKKTLDALNSFLDRSFKELRPLIRAVIAKAVGGKAKAESLQTIGSVGFKEYRIKPGAFKQELESTSDVLDLTKAFKNRKPQQCGIAWNGVDVVISVRAKKEFQNNELKELREKLPKGKAAGAKILSCCFRLEGPKEVVLEIDGERKLPDAKHVKGAIKNQAKGKKVDVKFVVNVNDDKKAVDKNKADDKREGNGKGTGANDKGKTQDKK